MILLNKFVASLFIIQSEITPYVSISKYSIYFNCKKPYLKSYLGNPIILSCKLKISITNNTDAILFHATNLEYCMKNKVKKTMYVCLREDQEYTRNTSILSIKQPHSYLTCKNINYFSELLYNL